MPAGYNPVYGGRYGGIYGQAADEGGMRDATSGILCPVTASDWATVLTMAGIASGGPTSSWSCQDASGNLVDAIGPNTLTKFGGPTYQNLVAGWSRFAIAQAGTDDFFKAGPGNITTTSNLLLAYAKPNTAPAGVDNIMDFGATVSRNARINATPVYTAVGLGDAQVTGTGAANPSTTVRPVLLQLDRTNAAFRVITDQEVIAPAYTAPAGGAGNINFGPNGTGPVSNRYLLGALFSGAAAELSTAQIHALLLTLGWTLGW